MQKFDSRDLGTCFAYMSATWRTQTRCSPAATHDTQRHKYFEYIVLQFVEYSWLSQVDFVFGPQPYKKKTQNSIGDFC